MNDSPDIRKGEALTTWAVLSAPAKSILAGSILLCPDPAQGQQFTANQLTVMLGLTNPGPAIASMVRDGLLTRTSVDGIWFGPTPLGRACMDAAFQWNADDHTPTDRLDLLPHQAARVFRYLATRDPGDVHVKQIEDLANDLTHETVVEAIAELAYLDLVNDQQWPKVALTVAGNHLAEGYRDAEASAALDTEDVAHARTDAVMAIIELAGMLQQKAENLGDLAESITTNGPDSNPLEILDRLLTNGSHPQGLHTVAVTEVAQWIEAISIRSGELPDP